MCTVTFIARRNSYCVAMNRDEKLSRREGLPPAVKRVKGTSVLAPSEPGGGTWISANDLGVTFALINWYAVESSASGLPVSRGEVVKMVGGFGSPNLVCTALAGLPMRRLNPFRLVGFFPELNEVAEWRWDGKEFVQQNHGWVNRQWISSGFDEPMAQQIRGKTYRHACRQRSSGTLEWLRRLHRSHAPEQGPFSTCMHRADAATVSYSEIVVTNGQVLFRHHPGPPCRLGRSSLYRVHRKRAAKNP